MKRLLLFSIIALLSSVCYPQFNGKKIKCKDRDYVHKETGFSFPLVLEGLDREAVYAFDKKKENVGTNYSEGTLKVSVYVYPAYDGYEDRLRRKFLNSLLSVSVSGHSSTQGFEIEHTSFHSGKFLVHGYRTIFPYKNEYSLLSLYECGHWLLKFRISDRSSNSDKLIAVEERMRNALSAATLIESAPLSKKVDVHFQKTAFRDSLMLGCVMGGAFEKAKWLSENIDSLEMCAGIPSVYLEYYMAGFDGMLQFEKRFPNMNASSQTKAMLEYLNAVVDAGYLREFIANNRTVISKSDSVILDVEGFERWEKEHSIPEDLFFDHAIISNK